MPTRINTYEAVYRGSGCYARELHANFREKLSLEACEDAVQDAFADAWRSGAAKERAFPEFEAYIRAASRNRALNQVRAIEGESEDGPRTYTVYEDELGDAPDANLIEEQVALASYQSVLLTAFGQLPAVNQAALRDRYTVELSVAECAKRRAISTHSFSRLFTKSVKRLRLLIEHSGAGTCAPLRLELDLVGNTDRATRKLIADANRDHILTCLPCQAHLLNHKQGAGLLGTLPIPVAGGLLHRLLDRLPGFGGHADRVAAAGSAAEAAAGVGVTGAAGGAGGALLLGISAKTATVGACGLITTGACIFGGQQLLDTPDEPPAKSPPKRAAAPAKKAAAPLAAASRSAPVVVPASTLAKRTGTPTSPPTVAVAKPGAKAKAKRKVKRIATATVLPTRATKSSSRTPAPIAPAAASPAPVLPQKAPTAPSSSTFSSEFAP